MKTRTNTRHRIFCYCGMIAPAILGAIVLLVGYITPDYNPISDSVSLMGTPEQPYAWMLNRGYWIYGILMSFAAYGFSRIFSDVPELKRLSILLYIHSFGTILLAVFPDSTTSFARELTHNAMSFLAYAPLLAGIFLIRKYISNSGSFRLLKSLGLFVLLVNIPLPFVHMFGPVSSIGGILQRVMCGFSFIWLRSAFYLLYKSRDSFETGKNNTFTPAPERVTDYTVTDRPLLEVGNILHKEKHY